MRSRPSHTIVVAMALLLASLAPAATLASGSSFEATFSTDGGNEWWIEADVDGNEPVTRVDTRIDGGDWQPLDHKEWGEWAASYHAPEGSTVAFRATSADGDSDVSQAYVWTSGEPAGETGGDGSFDATFATDGGNEWWIEADVDGNEPVTRVDTRIDGGDWQPLDHKDWGEWAASYHAPEGSTVAFRATSADGETVTSDAYRWTSGEAIDTSSDDGSVPDTMEAAFGPKAGNAWWVEVYVVTNGSIANVEARTDGGAWHELTYRDWGAWAGSFHVPEGSEVTFRAVDEQGAVDTSQAYLWPQAVPADDPDAPWPTTGNYTDYHVHGGGPTSDISYEMEALYVHGEDGWVVRCQGHREDPNGREETFGFARLAPPEGPSHASVGEEVDVGQGACHRGSYENLTVQGQEAYDTRQNGRETTVSAWYANRTADCRCQAWEAYWETETDLVTEWWRGGRSGDVGELADTDAPMSEG